MLTLGFSVFFWMCVCACVLKWKRKLCQFDRAATVPLRGLLVLLVVFAHLAIKGIDPAGVLGCFKWQNAAVAVFFFMSGYGQMCALKSKPEYLDGLIKRTAIKLFVPFLIILSSVVCGEILFGGLDMARVLSICKRGDFILVPHVWYVVVLFVLTIVFSVLARRLRGVYLLFGVFVAVVSLGGLFKCGFHWPRWWWLSLHAYPIGMFYCYSEERLRQIIKGNAWLYVVAGSLFLAVCILNGLFRFNEIEGVMRAMIGPMVAMGFYVLPIPQRCKALSFLGVISLELYLCHGVVRQWMLRIASGDWRTTAGLLSVVVAIGVAWLLHKLVGKMNEWGLKHV